MVFTKELHQLIFLELIHTRRHYLQARLGPKNMHKSHSKINNVSTYENTRSYGEGSCSRESNCEYQILLCFQCTSLHNNYFNSHITLLV